MTGTDIRAVPAEAATRERLRAQAARLAARLDPTRAPDRSDLQGLAREALAEAGLPACYLGFAMVAVDNAFWQDRFAAVPFHRRLLLLPHCLREPDRCRGHYTPVELSCAGCGACVIDGLQRRAEALGYRVLVAEGTPAVVQVVLDGQADAILGVACMESLEKAFVRISELGIPHVSLPLLNNGCLRTRAEVELIGRYIELSGGPAGRRASGFIPLLRWAASLFERGTLEDLLAGVVGREAFGSAEGADALTATERTAIEWLRRGGKRFRPFVTLASYAAMALGDGVFEDPETAGRVPLAVRRVAVAIEALHKASLVHDDIEDDDAYRYGVETLHRRLGVAQAINVGDYLVGLGYRIVAAESETLGPAVAADILRRLSEAHQKLCRGQGAELALRERMDARRDARALVAIYGLKTAPAFHVAMAAGLRMADCAQIDDPLVGRFCRMLGVAFQTCNDLKDWQADGHDKRLAGQDALARRPTLLEALAHEAGVAPVEVPGPGHRDAWVAERRAAYEAAGVFRQAGELVDACRQRALEAARGATPRALGRLMEFIVHTVLP